MRVDETAHNRAGAAVNRQSAFPTGRASFDPPLDSTAWLWRHVVGLLGDEREQIAGRHQAHSGAVPPRAAVGRHQWGAKTSPWPPRASSRRRPADGRVGRG
ncbi:hypothetical protein AB0I77_03245 [Streptomyces sp. NPDC050619]|uniref:hypothetical protein n=1 Tax=Streptomyces sp. NPDC050619 TaxID=3157214 RepID=UPI00342455B3